MTNPSLRAGVERYYGNRGDICLCLSGGGFRAAAFHLGVVRWLYASGLLHHVKEVRSVSGGSLVAGWMFKNQNVLFASLADQDHNWFYSEFAQPLRNFLARDIRSIPIATTLGLNMISKRRRCHLLANRVDSLLSQTADGLPVEGLSFRFLSFDVHENELVELEADTTCLALQVVASAAYPPVFGPVEIDGRHLVDGGMASNLGVTGSTLNEWLCILVSDASRAFPGWTRSRIVPLTLRLFPILKDGANRAFRSQIGAANSDTTVVSVAPLSVADWFGTNHGIESLPVSGRATRLRTDLAGFSPRRIGVLEGLGHSVASTLYGDAIETWASRINSGDHDLRPSQSALRQLLERWHQLQ